MFRTPWKPAVMGLAIITPILSIQLYGGEPPHGQPTVLKAWHDGNGPDEQVRADESSTDDWRTPLLVYAQSIMFGAETLSDQHIDQVRNLGPRALDKLLALRQIVINDAAKNDAILTTQLSRLDHLIDEVGAQRYCTYSGLYWYTDWQQAVEVSKKNAQPILSLHMLGQLTDELSCPDSRIFRLVLYANEAIANELRQHFVLHWHSVRPLPRVTVDFGDGRQIQTTLASNSIHYVIDAEGNVLDGIPGRCSPQHFLAWLQRVSELHRTSRTWSTDEFATELAAFHQSRISTIKDGWACDKNGPSDANGTSIISSNAGRRVARFAAFPSLAASDVPMDRLAQASLDEACFDEISQSLLRQFEPLHGIVEPNGNAAVLESAFQAAMTASGRSLALDSAWNEYHLHRRLHEWFVGQANGARPSKVNGWVYANLFRMPLDDRWYGLLGNDASSGLARNGIVEPDVDQNALPGFSTGSFDDRLKNLSESLFQQQPAQ